MRVRGEDALHIRQPHMLHHRQDFLTPRAGVEIGVGAQHLVDLAADRHDGIERGHRLLEDHRHPRGAELPQPPVAGGEQFLADQFDVAARRHQRALLLQAHHGERCHRLARAAFADQAERLAFTDLQREVVDDAMCIRLAAEADDEIADVEDDVGHRTDSTGNTRSDRDVFRLASFRGDAEHRTRNLEIPGLVLTHHPGMTASIGIEAVTCPHAASCGDRARRARRRRSG